MRIIFLIALILASTGEALAASGNLFTKAERAYYQLAEDCKVQETQKCDQLEALALKAWPKKSNK